MKRIVALFLVIFTVFSLCAASLVNAAGTLLVDEADLLTDSEESKLNSILDEISQRQKFDIVIVTVDSLDGRRAQAYADDYFDYNGYGQGENRDGVLILVSMKNRDWAVSTSGFGMDVFSDDELDDVEYYCVSLLSEGDYYGAFTEFAQMTDEFITLEIEGEPFTFGLNLFISVAIGFVIAFIIVSSMKSKLKTVRRQPTANAYTKEGSMNINESRDLYLYSHLSRRPKPKDNENGSHRSSSGRSHGGRSGKF